MWFCEYKSQKVLPSVCRDGSLKNQPNKMGMTPQYFHTILNLVPFANYAFVFVVCTGGLWKCTLMCMDSEFYCGWLLNVVATVHGRYGLSCSCTEAVECMSNAGSVWHIS